MKNIFDNKFKSLKHKLLFAWVEKGIRNNDMLAVKRWGKYLRNELTREHFEHWMGKFPGLKFSGGIIELFYFADQDTQKKVFELAALCRRDYYCRAWAHLAREEFLESLLRWHHDQVVDEVVDKYDPTFLTWIGLRFNRPEIYERFYLKADGDLVKHMLEHRVFEENEHTYWNLDYYAEQRAKNLETLQHLQRDKLNALVGDHGELKRRKL